MCSVSNWHGSWHNKQTDARKRPVRHVICERCEEALKREARAHESVVGELARINRRAGYPDSVTDPDE